MFTTQTGKLVGSPSDLYRRFHLVILVLALLYYTSVTDAHPSMTAEDYLLDLWLTTLHTSKKLPRPTKSAPPDLPTPLQSRLLTLLSTLRQRPDPIPRPQIETQNPIPDDPFVDPRPPPPSSSSSSTTPPDHPQPPPAPGARRITWDQLPRFMEAVKLILHDEPGRASGFSELEVWAWEDLVAFLALCARDQIVPDPEAAARGLRQDGSQKEGEGAGGLDAVAVRMLKGALEVRHFPTAALSASSPPQDGEEGQQGHGVVATIKEKVTGRKRREEAEAEAAAAREQERGQVAEAVKLNVYVAAAALWAVIMGEELWERQGQKVESPVGLSLEPVPEIPAGKISKPRWQMWIDRFQFMSLREDLRMSTRELAAEAAAVMLRVV